VVVTDRHGKHVYGLSSNDFHIFENGHEVAIRDFTPPSRQPQLAATADVPPALQTVRHQPGARPVIILFFDQPDTPATEQPVVRRQLALWMKDQATLTAPMCVILYTGSAVRILQQPTFDAARVRAAVESIPTTVNSQGAGADGELPLPAGANENFPSWTGDGPLRTLGRMAYFWMRATKAHDTESALIYAGQLFAAWPYEKALIWISAGTTTQIQTVPLQAAQVKLYPLNVHGLKEYSAIASFTRPDTTYHYETDVNRGLFHNMQEAAEETGGEICNDPSQPQDCIHKALESATEPYVLTYETHSRSKRPEWRKISVKIDQPGLRVSARSGVLISPGLTGASKKREQIAYGLASPVDLPGLRIDLQSLPAHVAEKPLTLALLLRSDAQHPGVWEAQAVDFTVVGIVLRGLKVVEYFGEDVHGSLDRTTMSQLEAGGLKWTHNIRVPNNATALRVVVRDNTTGRIGSRTEALQ